MDRKRREAHSDKGNHLRVSSIHNALKFARFSSQPQTKTSLRLSPSHSFLLFSLYIYPCKGTIPLSNCFTPGSTSFILFNFFWIPILSSLRFLMVFGLADYLLEYSVESGLEVGRVFDWNIRFHHHRFTVVLNN